MTHEEMERTMEFILAQQAKFSVDIDLLKESQAALTNSVTEMKAQADLDRAIMQGAISEMRDGISEMRQGVMAMLLIAERLEKTTSDLAQAQIGTSQRVTRLEDRVTKLEQP
jgi:signal transduction histidine kinase